MAVDKASYHSWQSPLGGLAHASAPTYQNLHRLGKRKAGEPGHRGSRATPCPSLPPGAWPIGLAIWPAKASLLPRPPPLLRLKLINGSAIAAAIGCKPYQHGTSIFAQNKRRTEARAAATRLRWGRGGRRPLELSPPPLRTLRPATGEARAAAAQL